MVSSFLTTKNYLCISKRALMGKKAILILLALVSFSAVALCADKRFTLVIDAGHGGHDTGARVISLTKKTSILMWHWLSGGM